MRNIFISMLRPIVKGVYRLIKKIKIFYRKMLKKRKSHSVNAVPVPVHYKRTSPKAKRLGTLAHLNIIWKERRFVIAACASVVVITVVLSIVLPHSAAEAQTAQLSLASPVTAAGTPVTTPQATESGLESTTEPAQISPQVSVLPTDPASSDQQEGSSPDAVNSETSVLSLSENEGAPLTAADTEPLPTTAPDKPNLIPGCTDPRMLDVQERLMMLGYMAEDEPTDYYGYGTEYALQLFQRKHGLQVDGLLGTQTEAALFSKDAMPYTLKLGDRGTDVEGIQERLQELKYLKAGSTGYFGTDTENAVKSFQKRNGLTSDGNVGDHTLEVLYSDDAKAAKVSSSGGSSGGSNGGSNSGSGSGSGSGSDVSVPPPADPDSASADALIEFAKTQLGKKYVRGGKGPNSFDCSGFVYYSLNQVGYKIKYMTSAGWGKSSLPKVSKMSDLQKGDIICFKGHVGIYMGDGKMIDASSGQGKIRITSNIFKSSYWTRNFICGRRVF